MLDYLQAISEQRVCQCLTVALESLKSKTGCRQIKFFAWPRINHQMVLLFKDSTLLPAGIGLTEWRRNLKPERIEKKRELTANIDSRSRPRRS